VAKSKVCTVYSHTHFQGTSIHQACQYITQYGKQTAIIIKWSGGQLTWGTDIFPPILDTSDISPPLKDSVCFAHYSSKHWCKNRLNWRKHIHTHIPFNGPFSGTTRVSRYQKSKTRLDFTEARDSEWQWHQLGHIQFCTSLQTDNHANTPPLSFFYRPDALPAAQPTASKHWRQNWRKQYSNKHNWYF